MLKYSKDGKVSFNPETHTYLMGDKVLEGVTTFIGRHKNKFDADVIAEKYAKKHGLIKEEVLHQWSEKGRLSCEYGTAVHNVFETFIKSGKIEVSGKHIKEKQAVKFINDFFFTNRLQPVDCEMIVYNNHLASQIDCIAKNNKGEHFILDWKTNETIKKECFNKYMLEPFNVYPDASYYHYSLQLCIYKELCKEYDIKDLFIVHIENEKYNIIKSEKIKLPNELFN